MTFDDSLPVIPPPSHLRQLITHVDAAHANELRQRWSTTGYGCCLAGGVVACCSRTQSICAQSSTEAKLIAANAAVKVTKCLRFILHELGYTRQRFRNQDCPSQSTHESFTSCGNQAFCTSALATYEGHHSDSPSWSRESCGHAHESTRLGTPPPSRPLPHGALWQSLPVNCLGSASSSYFHTKTMKMSVIDFYL